MAEEVIGRPAASPPAPVDHRYPAARVLSGAALAGVGVTLVVFAALHLLPPTSDISPVRRTISEYALTSSAWAFDLGVLTLSAASVAVLAGLVMLHRIPALSGGTIFGTLWVAGLLTLVSFPKRSGAFGSIGNRGQSYTGQIYGGQVSSGQIHRIASLVAFLALPVAVLLIARRRGRARQSTAARWAFWLGIASLAWFSPIVIAVLTSPRAWWQQIPLGLVERGLALTEVLAVVALALLVRAESRSGASSGVQGGGELPDLVRADAAAAADQ